MKDIYHNRPNKKTITYNEMIRFTDLDIENLMRYVYEKDNDDFPSYNVEDDLSSIIPMIRKRIEIYKNLGEIFLVYRVVMVPENEIKKDNPGHFYFLHKRSVTSGQALDSIGFYKDDRKYLSVITAEANISAVDWYHTLWSNILYPDDDEITLKHAKFLNVCGWKYFNKTYENYVLSFEDFSK